VSIAVVGVGTNLGAREAAIVGARHLLDARPGIDVVRTSPIYETEPLGPPQGRYLNAAFRLETSLSLGALLRVLLRTEQRLGRMRDAARRWGPRSVDLDLLWDSRGPHESSRLTVPHAELEKRNFALAPALDVAPELQDRYGDALRRAGGRPPTWSRQGIVQADSMGGHLEIRVDADSIAEACALCVRLPRGPRRAWGTRHIILDPSPDRLADALRELLRTGFRVCCTTISHCSNTQWAAQFHGVNTGMPVEADVRLQTTSGTERDVHAHLLVDPRPL
jgi:2-amino-4-hydroxy-6-hydroxymethyldihydropteridine diphosphokinase